MKNPKIVYIYINILFLFFNMGVIEKVNGQNIAWITEAEQATDNGTSQDPSSVTTFNGFIYFIYVNGNREMVVAKKKGATIERQVVFQLEMKPIERWHICPTIGVDKNGYIHIMGDMHNDTWKYFRSNNPEDITTWSPRYDVPGMSITYPTIFYDNNREMFLCYRHRRDDKSGGNHRGGIIKYNTETDTFELLGGVEYSDVSKKDENNKKTYINPTKTMVWGNGFGGHNCWYVKPAVKLFFDRQNRMHLSANLINSCLSAPLGHESNTHIIYAYSDDLGKTWHKAGGETINSLPLTVDNASVVIDRTKQHDIYGGDGDIGAFDSDHPIIGFRLSSDESFHSLVWNRGIWEEIKMPNKTFTFMSNNKGYTAWFDGNEISISKNGKKWRNISGITNLPTADLDKSGISLDREYFKQTGNFRYHAKFKDYTKSSIITIQSGIGYKK